MVKKKIGEFIKENSYIIGAILLIIVSVVIIGGSVYAFSKFGNKPINEVPTWALWLMFGGGR